MCYFPLYYVSLYHFYHIYVFCVCSNNIVPYNLLKSAQLNYPPLGRICYKVTPGLVKVIDLIMTSNSSLGVDCGKTYVHNFPEFKIEANPNHFNHFIERLLSLTLRQQSLRAAPYIMACAIFQASLFSTLPIRLTNYYVQMRRMHTIQSKKSCLFSPMGNDIITLTNSTGTITVLKLFQNFKCALRNSSFNVCVLLSTHPIAHCVKHARPISLSAFCVCLLRHVSICIHLLRKCKVSRLVNFVASLNRAIGASPHDKNSHG